MVFEVSHLNKNLDLSQRLEVGHLLRSFDPVQSRNLDPEAHQQQSPTMISNT